MTKQYLNPKQALDIEPAAERNIAGMTECCLDVNGKNAAIMKGRGSFTWWLIWFVSMCLMVGLPLSFIGGSIEAGVKAYFGLVAILLLGFGTPLNFWCIRVWRHQLPLRFNRKTRKVYLHFRGKTYITDWDTIRAYLTVQSGLTGVGAPIRDPQINIEFDQGTDKPLTVFLLGTDRLDMTDEQQAATFWEYIRRYMEEGPEAVPAPDLDIWRPAEKGELLKLHWPFPILRSKNELFWPFDIAVFFPIRVVWFLISYPTEVLYYHLAKRIKVDPFPPEMEEPCKCDDGASS
ncbi:DUF6708 domain-containing protein [Denitromonas iodatirespirans]|uniref:DUF6708 domain-containing protein n=1 Tax=Denitromonas iodatirespirans TaxID=2795389 RepID=A0A944DES9_DENI1|nr:DUF6708 domain-containing protein [Denitromonas iodatirespirans]MBT0964242.1 hypothetical protein [Denitromonas iodatirespirans]